MKRSLMFVVSALALLISACSQPENLQTPQLEPQFGTKGGDSVEDVAYGQAGMLYVIGLWDSENVGLYPSSTTIQDAFLRRYDRSGNLVWETFFDVEPAYSDTSYVARLTAKAVAVDKSGNAIVAWSSTYATLVYDEANNRSLYEVAATFNYLSKYSPDGTRVWRVYTAPDTANLSNAVNDIALDSLGAIYTVSNSTLTKYSSSGTRSWVRTVAANDYPYATGVSVSSANNIYLVRGDGEVMKYSSGGTRLWVKSAALDGYDAGPYKIAAGLSDEVYVTGAYFDGYSESCDAGLTFYYYTMRAYKLSKDGARLWQKNVANGSIVEGQDCSADYFTALSGDPSLTADTLGNVYIAGFQDGSGGQDGFVAKYSRAGVLAWKKGFGTARDDTARGVATYDGSEVFVGGVTEGYLVHRPQAGGDAFMREVNSRGEKVWAH